MKRFSLVGHAHGAVGEILQAGDCAVDATVGNGHDTLFLARQVGESGKVYGFDIQQAALDAAWQRLEEAGTGSQVSLYHAGHELMAMLIPESRHGEIKAIMFNLGYLPGGDRLHMTHAATTIAALQGAVQLLQRGGRISVLAYTGHPGGREEAEMVKAWSRNLNTEDFSVNLLIPPGANEDSPELILIERASGNTALASHSPLLDKHWG